MNHTQYIIAQIQSLADGELVGMVDPQTLARLKTKETHPEIRAYAIGHEGTANFRLPDNPLSSKIFRWAREAVGWLHDKLSVGTKVFNRHSQTNSHEGRTPVGEVVGKTLKDIDGVLTSIAAFYIYPEYREEVLDVASIEASIVYDTEPGGYGRPINVENITGIAVSDSRVDSPGFPGATLLSAVAAFAGENMTLAEIKKFVEESGYRPSQVFPLESLTTDNTVVEFVKTEKRNVWEQNKRLEDEVGKLKDDMAKQSNEYDAKLKEAASTVLMAKSTSVLDKLISDRKLTPKQAEYVKADIRRFKSESDTEDGLSKDVNVFIDEELTDMAERAKLFGVELTEEMVGETGKDRTTTTVNNDDLANLPVDADDLGFAELDANPLWPGSTAYKETVTKGA